MQPGPPFEQVYTIDDWYDGPIAGFASYHGRPHHYRAVFQGYEDAWDRDEEYFDLVLVSDETLRSAIEAKEIFDRWDAARRQGAVVWTAGDDSTFGALPKDRERYQHLRTMLAPYADAGDARGRVVRGDFSPDSTQVRWIDVSDSAPSNDR